MTSELSERIRSWGELIDRALDRYLGDAFVAPDRLRDAVRYSVFAGGKRLRPLLVLLACDACLGSVDLALPAAAAVEMIHTYSLIHDDLPAMDDDDLRRGQPSCHRKFDEATAILAGDALLTQAFRVLCDVKPAALAVQCSKELSQAAGAAGMVGGQIDDLAAHERERSLEWLQSLHARKTGALLTVSLRLGALIATANRDQLNAITQYGERVGLAFQIADDLLDVEGKTERVGKTVHKDKAAGKLTYPGLLGIEESRSRARQLAAEASACLEPLGQASRLLAQLAEYIIERDR